MNCLMGDGSDGEASKDCRNICTALLDGEPPPLTESIDSSERSELMAGVCGFICNDVAVGSTR